MSNLFKPKPEPLWKSIGRFGLILGSLYIAHEILSRQSRPKKDEPLMDKNGTVIDLSKSQWDEFWENGFVKIGKTLTSTELNTLKIRINDIMKGNIQYGDKLLMQIDESNIKNISNKDEYDQSDLDSKGQTTGFKGDDYKYRQIGGSHFGLEHDDLYLNFMKKAIFRNICNKIYGKHNAISMYRAMIFNKPALVHGGGSYLPWHQDGGTWWALDRDPLMFCWTALFDITVSNGCVQAIRGSYKNGVITKNGHMLNKENQKKYCKKELIVNLECKAGETWLIHTWTIHRSNTNSTAKPRWAFAANYIDARTVVLDPKPKNSNPIAQPGKTFQQIFPSPFQ